jgi:hypothetical protein
VTALVHHTAGNAYFLVWCPFHFASEKTSLASPGLPRDKRAIVALTGFTDYRDNVHIGSSLAAVLNEAIRFRELGQRDSPIARTIPLSSPAKTN